MGMALAMPGDDPQLFEYFLNHDESQAGHPARHISYHFYASPRRSADDRPTGSTRSSTRPTGFMNTVRYIESIRKRLSPETKTDTDELGVILPTDNKPGDDVPPSAAYWNLAGSLYAYLFIELSRLQIDIIGESQLIGYPTQFPSVSMMNWANNKPNARFWVLKLIKDNFHPGDKLVETKLDGGDCGGSGRRHL